MTIDVNWEVLLQWSCVHLIVVIDTRTTVIYRYSTCIFTTRSSLLLLVLQWETNHAAPFVLPSRREELTTCEWYSFNRLSFRRWRKGRWITLGQCFSKNGSKETWDSFYIPPLRWFFSSPIWRCIHREKPLQYHDEIQGRRCNRPDERIPLLYEGENDLTNLGRSSRHVFRRFL